MINAMNALNAMNAMNAMNAKAAKDTEELRELEEGLMHGHLRYDLLEEMENFKFEGEELEGLIWTFVNSDYHDDEVVRFLVDKGLGVDQETCEDETPLARAIGHDYLRAARALLKAGATPNNSWNHVFSHALFSNNVSAVRLLIEYGADVNIGEDKYRHGTALHDAAFKAVEFDDLTCLKLFLEAGAKERAVNVEDEVQTPTQYIQKEYTYGGKDDKVDAVKCVVDLLYEYSSAGKRLAKVIAGIDSVGREVKELALSGGALSIYAKLESLKREVKGLVSSEVVG